MKLNEPFKHLMPSLPAEVFANLKADIEANGLHSPILVDEENNILDGHNRYAICQQLGMEPAVKVEPGLADDLQKHLRVFAINLNKRHLEPADRKRIDRLQRDKAMALLARGVAVRAVARLIGRPHNTILGWKGGRADQGAQDVDIPVKNSTATAKNSPENAPVSRASLAVNSAEQKDKALKMAAGGMTATQIGAAIGRGRMTVTGWLQKPGAPTGFKKEPAVNDEEVKRLFDDGMPVGEVAKRLDVHPSTVTAARRRLGIGRAGKITKNPLARYIDRADAEASVWSTCADDLIDKAAAASLAQRLELLEHLDRLGRAVARLKGRLNKNATRKAANNGEELQGTSH